MFKAARTPLPLLLLSLSAFAAEQTFTWRGVEFKYEGGELKWTGDSTDPNSEPLLIFKSSDPEVRQTFTPPVQAPLCSSLRSRHLSGKGRRF